MLVIIGLLTSVAVFTLHGKTGSLRNDARALAARAKLLAQESIIKGVSTGLLVTSEGYAFYYLDAGKWREWSGERAFERKSWRPGVVADMNRAANAGLRSPTRVEAKGVMPSVVFDPTGVVTPFSMSLAEGSDQYVVSSNERGEVVVFDKP